MGGEDNDATDVFRDLSYISKGFVLYSNGCFYSMFVSSYDNRNEAMFKIRL